jgi:hypothetical protein
MSVSRLADDPENHPGSYGRRAADENSRPASREDAELKDWARRLAPARPLSQPPAALVADEPDRTAPLGLAANLDSGAGGAPSSYHPGKVRPAKRRGSGWARRASTIAPAGAALFGAALVIAIWRPWAGPAGTPKLPASVGAGQGRTTAPEPGGQTVAAKGDVDAARLKAIAPAAADSSVQTDHRSTGVDAHAKPPSSPAVAASATPAGTPQAAPLASAVAADPPPAAPPSPDAHPVRAASAPPEAAPAAAAVAAASSALESPDSDPQRAVPARPDAALAGPAAGAGPPSAAPQAPDPNPGRKASPPPAATAAPPQPPAEPAPPADRKAVAVAQPTPPKAGLPTKPQRRLSLRGRAPKTMPAAASETRRDPQRPEAAPATPAAAEPPPTPAPADPKEPVNLFAHVLGASADQAKTSGWAIQFAAPKSEAEAEAAAARLNAKYAGALNGATIAVHKTEANGETTYALRAAGLSKADAAALCERVKGRDCSTVK